MKTSQYWNAFYGKKELLHEPSPFAKWCLAEQWINQGSAVLELGCGNGRDAFCFIHHNIYTLAVDASAVAIEQNSAQAEKDNRKDWADFISIDFSDIEQLKSTASEALAKINTVYCRFVLHAVPKPLADKVLDFSFEVLPTGGKICLEFRTINDPLFQQGEAISETERITDHYRRFIDAEKFRTEMKNKGWKELYFLESDGLAIFKQENPVVARFVFAKP